MSASPSRVSPRTGLPAANFVTAVSQSILKVEKILAGLFMGLLLSLILLNVVTRFLRMPIYWIDEASIFAMIWLGMIGASVMTRLRIDFAVTLVSDYLPPKGVRFLRALANGISLLFAIGFVVMCWIWLDPIGIASSGFDASAYAAQSFNFLYTENTQTLEWPTWIVTSILPIFAITLSIHTLANLLEDLGFAEPVKQVSLTPVEGAV